MEWPALEFEHLQIGEDMGIDVHGKEFVITNEDDYWYSLYYGGKFIQKVGTLLRAFVVAEDYSNNFLNH